MPSADRLRRHAASQHGCHFGGVGPSVGAKWLPSGACPVFALGAASLLSRCYPTVNRLY